MRGITNAQQKNGVTTINTIAPDANNNFEIEAGTGVTITPGTNKITIDASGGGDWVTHSGSDWTDLFTLNVGTMIAKYDISIYYNNTPFIGYLYIPKGTSMGQFRIPVTGSRLVNNVLRIGNHISFFGQDLASSTSNFTMSHDTYTFTTDGSTVTITSGNATQNVSKSTGLLVKYK